RCRSRASDRLGRRVERERRTDHLVAGPDLERVQDEDERIGAVAHTYRLANPEVARSLLLERGDVRPEDELTALEHVLECARDLRKERRVLRLDVDEWDSRARAHRWRVYGSIPASSAGSGGLNPSFLTGRRTPRIRVV